MCEVTHAFFQYFFVVHTKPDYLQFGLCEIFIEREKLWTQILTLSLLMSYICGAPCKARNFNVVYIWTYVWHR
jgi:hypothetical protein